MLSSRSYQTCLSHVPSSRLQWLLSLWQTHWEIISLGSMLKTLTKLLAQIHVTKKWEQHFRFVGQKSTLILLKCVQKIEKEQDQKICDNVHNIQTPLPRAVMHAFFGTLSEAWYSPESPHPTPGQPFQPELTMPFTSLWGGQGLGDFLLFMWFSLMKFSSCKSWHLLDGFQAVRKTVPCQKAKHYSPSTEVYP